MITNRYIFQRPDGTLHIVCPMRDPRPESTEHHPDGTTTVTPAETAAEYDAVMIGGYKGDGVHVGTLTTADFAPDAAAVLPVVDAATLTATNAPHPDPVRCWRGAWRWDGATGAIVHDAAAVTAQKWDNVRRARDELLKLSDGPQKAAAAQGKPTAPAWDTFQQALRDVPSQADPDAIAWPVKP